MKSEKGEAMEDVDIRELKSILIDFQLNGGNVIQKMINVGWRKHPVAVEPNNKDWEETYREAFNHVYEGILNNVTIDEACNWNIDFIKEHVLGKRAGIGVKE